MTTRSKKQLSLIEQTPKPKKGKRPIPPDWIPPQRAYALADQFRQSVEHVEGIFRDYCAANGVLYADHDAAFCNFIRNQARFDNRGRANVFPNNHGQVRGSIVGAFDRQIAHLEREIASDREVRSDTFFGLPVERLR
jgi:hypothetical protein